MAIKIMKDCYIGGDAHNVILYVKWPIVGGKGKHKDKDKSNTGQRYMWKPTYHPNFRAALKAAADKIIRRDIVVSALSKKSSECGFKKQVEKALKTIEMLLNTLKSFEKHVDEVAPNVRPENFAGLKLRKDHVPND